ncbi:cytochrome c family protein [uncultured Bartonella sp.]|uniref:c-type cytochrome n=1 Tax=uncultured Bartonella sp. TaxID=104108 RepID=UPI00262A0F9B|nr:cytochrome c family protein [uncultured Bartonella sp.]
MNVSTVNNVIAACLLWAVLVFIIVHMSDLIYDHAGPEKIVYSIDGEENQHVEKSQIKQQVSLSDRLQHANLENGRKVFGQCGLCHTPAKNGPARVGPPLYDVVDRPFASISDFTYSRAMRAQGNKKWDFATLDAYLAAPRKYIPGTAMAFIGVKDAKDRADLILYLRSLSDKPAELPHEKDN